jgi:hypothetical protein
VGGTDSSPSLRMIPSGGADAAGPLCAPGHPAHPANQGRSRVAGRPHPGEPPAGHLGGQGRARHLRARGAGRWRHHRARGHRQPQPVDAPAPGRHGGQAGVPAQAGHRRDRRRLLPDGQRRLRHGGRVRAQPGRGNPERPAIRDDRRDAGGHLRPRARRRWPARTSAPQAPTGSASTSPSSSARRSSAASPAPPSS